MDTALENNDDIIIDRTRVRAKWGLSSRPGFGTYPVVLMLYQARLGIDPHEMNVLMHLVTHWHAAERAPFPHSKTIAKRMGLGIRKVQRCLKSLQDKGFIARVEKKTREDRLSYDLRPLADKLAPFAVEWHDLRVAAREQEAIARRQQVAIDIQPMPAKPAIQEVDFDFPF